MQKSEKICAYNNNDFKKIDLFCQRFGLIKRKSQNILTFVTNIVKNYIFIQKTKKKS